MATVFEGTFERIEGRRGAGGFLRQAENDYAPRRNDARVSDRLVGEFALRGGEDVTGATGAAKSGRDGTPELASIETINGRPAAEYLEVKPLDELVPIDPQKQIHFETPGGPMSMRVIDLMTPIGMGQRGLIVAAPRTGKTILLQQMATGVTANLPEARLIVLLVDERPEEVTEIRRSVRGEVVASCNDKDTASHVRLARIVIDKGRRAVECGQDVVVLMDSLTRLGRAFNAFIRGSGRIMSGGLDIRALTEPKAIFGAARNIEHGGSLTIIASVLVETGSRMDEVIFNEFKGTGNMEIMLSRDLANKRIWPAIDLAQSGTRKEEILLGPEVVEKTHQIRRSLAGREPDKQMEALLAALGKFPDNRSFLANLAIGKR